MFWGTHLVFFQFTTLAKPLLPDYTVTQGQTELRDAGLFTSFLGIQKVLTIFMDFRFPRIRFEYWRFPRTLTDILFNHSFFMLFSQLLVCSQWVLLPQTAVMLNKCQWFIKKHSENSYFHTKEVLVHINIYTCLVKKTFLKSL